MISPKPSHSSTPSMLNIHHHRQSNHTFRHQTVSASRNHGVTASMNSSGDGIRCGSMCGSAMRKTSHVVRLVRAKAELHIPWGISMRCGLWYLGGTESPVALDRRWFESGSGYEIGSGFGESCKCCRMLYDWWNLCWSIRAVMASDVFVVITIIVVAAARVR